MQNIIYIGNSSRIANILSAFSPEITIKAVFYQPSKISDKEINEMADIAELCPVNNQSEIEASISEFYNDVDFALMYSFGIIIPKKVVESTNIFNFHPGSLIDNRGSSPVNWAILLNWFSSCMSLHKITPEIDLGELISEHECKIYSLDTPETLRFRLEGEIPSMILELLEHLKTGKKGKIITGGTYRERITESDYTIDSVNDTNEIIKAKIRSQASYNGAIFLKNGTKYYVKTFDEYLRRVSE